MDTELLELAQHVLDAARDGGRTIAGFAIATVYDNGDIGGVFLGDKLEQLLAAVSRIDHRINLELDRVLEAENAP